MGKSSIEMRKLAEPALLKIRQDMKARNQKSVLNHMLNYQRDLKMSSGGSIQLDFLCWEDACAAGLADGRRADEERACGAIDCHMKARNRYNTIERNKENCHSGYGCGCRIVQDNADGAVVSVRGILVKVGDLSDREQCEQEQT